MKSPTEWVNGEPTTETIQRIGLGYEKYQTSWMGNGGQPHQFEGIELGELCDDCVHSAEKHMQIWLTR